ncbi:hypothetical protein HYC85_007895 [Camellia sinensis]|uniref:Plant heme peroxidase family profile domain-containing protein n=1 Tax=Camellia sinensis TaxID=4442 RepID=A0A7J7HQW5_CAMSI|nr:hypothetical protein HYC85_007895 [Camellia sinensis]
MAERLSLTSASSSSSSSMAALSAASRLLPSATKAARLSLSTPSPSLSPCSSLKCLRSSRLLSPHLFLRQRRSAVHVAASSFGTVASPKCFVSDPDQLKSAREDIKELLNTKFCHPILGTYNKNIEEWPQRGGADGSLRFEIELKHAANAGLVNALKLLETIKDKYSGVTYADLFQLASATAIEEAGGPKIPMKYGRVDTSSPDQCPEEGRLPVLRLTFKVETSCLDAGPPNPAAHLREVFYRMGLNDKEIVALSGAHTLGRSRPERSGWGKPETKYTDIKERMDEDLLVLPTDAVLFEDPAFKVKESEVYAEKYAADQDEFFKDYAEAHAKLSNLGAKFDPPEGISIDDGPATAAPEKFVAAKYSSGKRELSDSMKQKIRAEYEAIGGSPDKPLQSNYFLNIIIVIAVLAILTSLFGN